MRKSLEEKFEKDTSLDTCLQLLPDAETNIPVILASNEKLREKIKVLENKWETDKKILLSKRVSKSKYSSVILAPLITKNIMWLIG